MSKRRSLTKQAQDELQKKLRIGESKYQAKKENKMQNGIYSWATYRTYIKHVNYFLAYCKEKHNCRYLDECKQYAQEWIDGREHLSAYTQKLEASALQKLYSNDLVLQDTKKRNRGEIKRSREKTVRDKHFSKTKNHDLIEFCRSTGLRRSELEHLKGSQLWQDEDNNYYIHTKGKGGRERDALVVHNIELVVELCNKAADSKVFAKVHSNADIHSYRADYCHNVYDLYARDLNTIPRDERYYCRNDKKGMVYDKKAMLIASENLGHSRINVIASHYLR